MDSNCSNRKMQLKLKWPASLKCATAAFALVTSACSFGPQYVKPAAPTATRYTFAKGPDVQRAGAGQPVVTGQAFRYVAQEKLDWWTSFRSSALNRLVSRALANNFNIAAAKASLDATRFDRKAADAAFYPHVSLGSSATREQDSHLPGSAPPQDPYSLYSGGVSISYNPGVFGLNSSVKRAANARYALANDELNAVKLTVAGNVVLTTIRLAAAKDVLRATQRTVADEVAILRLTKDRYSVGSVSKLDVLSQESQLAATKAKIPVLQQTLDADQHLLAVYLGQAPLTGHTLRIPTLADLRLPPTVPVSLPSTLVQTRPDILAAEAQLRVANAQVGAEVARMFPSVTLTSSFGSEATSTSALFDPATRLWTLAAGLVLPIFEGGRLKARVHAAQAAYLEVFASYKATVLEAFEQVADVLRAMQHDEQVLNEEQVGLQSSRTALALARIQYQAGATNYVELLVSEVQYENAIVSFIGARAKRVQDNAALYVALGDGISPASHATDATSRSPGAPTPHP